jgi:thiol:disulfide interchange protein DsbD
VVLRFAVRIQPGWHVYSMTTPKGGPLPTRISVPDHAAVESFETYQPPPLRKRDQAFGIDVEAFEKQAVFLAPVVLRKDAPAGPAELSPQLRYQVCDDRQCINKRKTLAANLIVDAAAPAPPPFSPPPGYSLAQAQAATAGPVPAPLPAANAAPWTAFLLTAFGLGVLAVFTPCVFPMIPVTVSFFLNQRGGLLQAMVFALGIAGLFSALGLGMTALAGPFGVVELSANPWINAFIAAVFGLFAVSLLGAFEITLPSSILTPLDRASRRSGYLGTLLMGLTFSLASFACIGPFMGPLLVASAQGGGARPVIGMATFAAGLASPFFVLAAFPSWLKSLPKSGEWLARVKVVMGFVLLAVMLKYISNIDQVLQAGILTRERFLAAWFVLFAMPGLYLLGLLRLEGVDPSARLGVGRLLAASALLVFAFSLLPGAFGARLGELDAYVPAAQGGPGAQAGPAWMKDQYREALDRGRAENKLILVTFTGYTCTNCHWMKANIFPRPEVAAELSGLVLVELYTDGAAPVHEENQAREERMFSTASLPFFAILRPDESVVATFPTATRSAAEFLAFLRSAKS